MKSLLLLCVILLFAYSASAYTDYTFSVYVRINPEGSAHVVEKTIFTLDSPQEKVAFEYALGLGRSALSDWQKYSKNIKYHLSGSVTNLKITATREFAIVSNAASVTLEYDVANSIMTIEKVGSRSSLYTLDSSFLNFGTSRSNEAILGSNMRFSIELPKDAMLAKLSPTPLDFSNNIANWTGPLTARWELSYEREQPISEEVNQFFVSLSDQLKGGLLYILAAALLLLVLFKAMQVKKE